MLLDGSVRWQNQLNDLSSQFLQVNKHNDVRASEQVNERISDSIFLNYWWNADMIKDSVKQANRLNRSVYDMYFGADLWPDRNAQRLFQRRDWLDALFSEDSSHAHSSIALFASNASFIFSGNKSLPAYSNFQNDSQDYLSYYQSEVRLFSGDDLNVYRDDKQPNWPGLGRFIPAKSTLSQLPFATSFNTGHGKLTAHNGKAKQGEWHDVAQQDVLPTWQFAIQGNKSLSVFYDFEQAYHGGSSLAIRGDLSKGKANIPLYQSAFSVTETSKVEFIAKQVGRGENLSLWLLTTEDELISFPFNFVDNQWGKQEMSLAVYKGKTIKKIGLHLNKDSNTNYSANIGYLSVQ
jgi:endo-beta-N-acetylglucosaminidase D